jgi:hypothetical protein
MQKTLHDTFTHHFAGRFGGGTRTALLALAICVLSTLFPFAPDSAIAAEAPSANGTRGTRVVDGGGAVWTFNGGLTLRNGAWAAGGSGQEYLYVNLSVYVISSGNVWRWHGSGWDYAGTNVAAIEALVSSGGGGGGSGGSGLREVVTQGSISGGSNQLLVANAAGFSVGEWVIVEIGREPGQGRPGTRGVGGTWPSKSYPTEAQLRSDGSRPNGQFAWAEDTGVVFWRVGGVWYSLAPNRPDRWDNGSYYLSRAVPRSLQARITAIKGNTLTLDRSAAVSVSSANVYLDTAPILNRLIASGAGLSLPAGRFPTGGVVHIQERPGFEFSGQGKDQTTIYSPKGVPSAMIQVFNSPSTVVRDFTLQGNFRDQGFGLNWNGSTAAGTWEPVTDTSAVPGAAFSRGILFTAGAQNSVAQDVRVIDVAQHALGVIYAQNVWGRRIENIQNDPMRQYITWQIQWSDTTGGGCEDCEVRSKYLIPGFEAFRSANVQFIRNKGTNATFAMNGSGGWFIVDTELRVTANSLLPGGAVTPFYWLVTVTANAGVTPYVTTGGTIRNVTMIQEGYVSAAKDTLGGILIDPTNPNIRVESSSYSAPNYSPAPGGTTFGAIGLNSKGVNTTVNGMRVTGTAIPHLANIIVERGSGQGCVAAVVRGCSR